MMPFMDVNVLAVTLMIVNVIFFTQFWPIWVENQHIITQKRLEKRALETKLAMFPPTEWCVFDDQTLYSIRDFNNKFINLLYKSPTPMGTPQTFNGNFVTNFYRRDCDK